MKDNVLLEVTGLSKHFHLKGAPFQKPRVLKAVDGIDLAIHEGETLGMVGESGCGKTTCGRTILRLYEPSAGTIRYRGQELTGLGQEELRPWRRKMQMIFQDPYASLNPRMLVKDIISEGIFRTFPRNEQLQKVDHLLQLVGLAPDHGNRFPHEFSGGQRQRIGIARALAMDPEFIVCDEPISSLDVSIQAQIVNMLGRLQSDLHLTYLFIAHDIAMVKHISDRIAVMYLGKMVEMAAADELYRKPAHPYTRSLLSAIPIPDPDRSAARQRIVLQGDVASPVDLPQGCRFKNRCPIAEPACGDEEPPLREVSPGHFAACRLL